MAIQQMLLGLGAAAPNVWATLSSADADTKDNAVPNLSNGNLTASNSASGWNHGRATLGFTTGKWYWEITPTGNAFIGVEPTSEDIDRQYFNEGTTAGMATRDGKVWFAGSTVSTGNNDWSDGDTIGFAFDADSDRVGIIDNESNYIESPYAFCIIADHVLESKEKRNISTTVSMTSMIDKIVKKYGVKCFRTKVGFKYVAPNMEKNNSILGGEESGGYSYSCLLYTSPSPRDRG